MEGTSWFGWLDQSERDRRRMLDIVDLFEQRESVDELGLGSVRDTIADVLSPGTSTIQTRARYFFFVPWTYLELERRGLAGPEMAAAARTAEQRTIRALMKSDDLDGAFGRMAGDAVKRLPAAVYWSGLRRLGFRIFDGPQQRYHRLASRSGEVANWNHHLPVPPEEWPEKANLALRRVEAEFFREQLRTKAQGSLFQFVVEKGDLGKSDLPAWSHPLVDSMPDDLRRHLQYARNYAELMHGATLLYNLMLSELSKSEERAVDYRKRLVEWVANIGRERLGLGQWSRPDFWTFIHGRNPSLPAEAITFSENWMTLVLGSLSLPGLIDSPVARDLVETRERRLKGSRSRIHSAAHLAQWGGASGAELLDYRWRVTRRLASDILRGLEV